VHNGQSPVSAKVVSYALYLNIVISKKCTHFLKMRAFVKICFLPNLRASLFNDDLSKETTFSQIHLAG
jgi:hypothetical protein